MVTPARAAARATWNEFGEMVSPLIQGWRSHQAWPRNAGTASTKRNPAAWARFLINTFSLTVASLNLAISLGVKNVSRLQSVPLNSLG